MGLEDVPDPLLIVGSIICVMGGGIAAGLTIGLMSLGKVELELLIESGNPQEASYAKKLAPIRKRGNLLLVTLLLTNTVFNELLPLMIDNINGVSSVVALILPTLTVMIFGEIIPQSFCTRYGLSVGARCVWLVRLLELIFLPIAFPMAWVLDKVLGEELGNIYSHKQLKGLIELHSHKRHGALTDVETTLLKGALDFSSRRVEEIMVTLQNVFMLEANSPVDSECVGRIWQSGRSRIPVCDGDRTNIIGMLFAKDLLVVRPEEALSVRTILTFYGQPVLKVWSDQKLDSIFNDFKSGKCHLAIVQRVNEGTESEDPSYDPVGIVTLEDVMEALIQDEILDENDEPGGGKHLRPSISVFASGKKGKNARLLPEQVAAIVMYLVRSVDPFRSHFLPEELVTRLVAKCGCTEVTQNPDKEVCLYTRGETTRNFTLILYGKFDIFSGDEKIRTEMGPWCYLGLPSLTSSSYKPDYTAKMTSPSAQLLVVTYTDYQEALRLADEHPPDPLPASIIISPPVEFTSNLDEPLLLE